MIEQGVPVQARLDLLKGIHDVNIDSFRLVLVRPHADLTLAATTFYDPAWEAEAPGYFPGGAPISQPTLSVDKGMVCMTLSSMVIGGDQISFEGAVLYNASKENRALLLIDFGKVLTMTNPHINMPAPFANSALFRY